MEREWTFGTVEEEDLLCGLDELGVAGFEDARDALGAWFSGENVLEPIWCWSKGKWFLDLHFAKHDDEVAKFKLTASCMC